MGARGSGAPSRETLVSFVQATAEESTFSMRDLAASTDAQEIDGLGIEISTQCELEKTYVVVRVHGRERCAARSTLRRRLRHAGYFQLSTSADELTFTRGVPNARALSAELRFVMSLLPRFHSPIARAPNGSFTRKRRRTQGEWVALARAIEGSDVPWTSKMATRMRTCATAGTSSLRAEVRVTSITVGKKSSYTLLVCLLGSPSVSADSIQRSIRFLAAEGYEGSEHSEIYSAMKTVSTRSQAFREARRVAHHFENALHPLA